MDNVDYTFKIVFAGDTNTGKTTICNTILDRANPTMQYQPTVGIDFNSMTTRLTTHVTDINIRAHLWDTAGQEKYRSIIRSYYRNTCATILLYDTTCRKSFDNLDYWLNEIRQFSICKHLYRHPVLLFGTKKDITRRRKVTYDEAYKFADTNGLIFYEVNSLKKVSGVESGYAELIQTIYDNVKMEMEAIPLAQPYIDNGDEYEDEEENPFVLQSPNISPPLANISLPLANISLNANYVANRPKTLMLYEDLNSISCKGIKKTANIGGANIGANIGGANIGGANTHSPKYCGKCLMQ